VRTFRLCSLAVTLTLAACGDPQEGAGPLTRQAESAARVDTLGLCAQLPAVIAGQPARRFDDSGATVYLAPPYPEPGQELWVLLVTPQPNGTQQVRARVTKDGWATQQDLDLKLLCTTTPTDAAPLEIWALSLGSYGSGAKLELALWQHTSSYGDRWLNNGGANYRFSVSAPQPLQWVGNSHLRLSGTAIPATLAPAGQPLQIYVETYPMGAAAKVELFWADASYGKTSSAVMKLDSDFTGAYGANSMWAATIPASDVKAGAALHYWVRAVDHSNATLWDSAGGSNYTLTPRAFPVGWAGGFGAYRPVSREYLEGKLWSADGSTATGCDNGGASMSSYLARAVRVYVPGLTDRAYASDDDRKAAASILRAEVWTDAASGWGSRPASFSAQVGNDFVYTFLTFNDLCAGGGPNWGARISDGTYGLKLRFSTDGGQTWFWRGSDNGPVGGANLKLLFGGACGYFNGPCPRTSSNGIAVSPTTPNGTPNVEAGSVLGPLQAIVTQNGKPLAGAKVVWGTASGTPGAFFPASSISDANGVVQTQWIPAAVGEETITGAVTGAPTTGPGQASASWHAHVVAVPRTANAVHLWYDFPPATAFRVEVVPRQDPPRTYYAAMMWEGGYAGIQRQGDLFDRQIHFSVWDVGGVSAVLIDKGASTCTSFGNEGTGIMCRFSYPWQINSAYRFEVQAAKGSSTTDLTVFFTDLASGKSIKAATLRYGKAIDLKSSAAFVEDFGAAAASCLATARRELTLRKPAALVGGVWQPITSALFTWSRPLTACANFGPTVTSGGITLASGGPGLAYDPTASQKLTQP